MSSISSAFSQISNLISRWYAERRLWARATKLEKKWGEYRAAAASALGALKDPRFFALKTKDGNLRESIATAFGYLGDRRAVGLLSKLLPGQGEPVRSAASVALKRLQQMQAEDK